MVFGFNSQILTFIVCLLIIWLLGVSVFLYRTISHYNRLVSKGEEKNLRKVLEKILKEAEIAKKEIENLQIRVSEIEKEGLFHLQKIGLLKFNPFKDIGGKQSFILSLLDRERSGVLITSLHGRETTRWYVKMVKKGKGVNYELSKEEMEVIKGADRT